MKPGHRTILLILAVLAVAALAASACQETFTMRYATWADAERDEATRRGWIPTFVPRSATNLHEIHDLDTNAQRLRFAAPPEALGAMTAGLEPIAGDRVPAPPRELAAPAGWPWALDEGGLPPGFGAYRSRAEAGSTLCVAVDRAGSVAYAWTCAGDR